MKNVVFLNPKNKNKLIEDASKELAEYLSNKANEGVPLEALIGLLDVYKTNITLEILTFEDR
tara:strand:- start:2151 stop:2336 length:186 start_codon:yes stop_codon:yes gene_type:complete